MTAVKAREGQDEVATRLLAEAGRLLAEHGPSALSLRRVAAEAGTSTMSVYTRFGDKGRLLAEMYRDGFRRLGAALLAVPQTRQPMADLFELGLAYRRAALDNHQVYDLMFGHPVPEFRPDEQSRATADAAYRPLVEAVRRCLDVGVLAGTDAERIALHLWSVSHGMVSLELNGHLPAGDLEQRYVEALVYAGTPFLPSDGQGTPDVGATSSAD
ncbi:MAG TPA: TetR/AcrR family transcriptional regulator [Jatrophihabitantaceae bacterium]|nr:TetR/AcrR family transcriptional regulator [Jatrophihabitantaceae bacterium]